MKRIDLLTHTGAYVWFFREMAAVPEVLSQGHGGLSVPQVVPSRYSEDPEIERTVAPGTSTHNEVNNHRH